MARRFQVPPLRGPLRQAGGWGLPGTGTGRPASAPVESFGAVRRLAIRTGEGTASGVVPASGVITLSAGPDGLNAWYVSYVAISTTLGAADATTAALTVGPISAGLAPAGQSYAGGGDSIGLGGQVLRPGDYVTVTWSLATPGTTAMMTVYGSQDVPAGGISRFSA